jgi:excinuclease ABC subunit C
VRRVTEKQFVSNTGDDLDVIGVAFDAGMACVHVLFIRQGKVLGSRSYFPKVPGGTELGEVVETFVGQFYLQGSQMRTLLLRSCSILILTIKPCWPIRCLNWRGVGSMYKPNRAAIVRVI